MKQEVVILEDKQLIRSSEYDKLELKHKKLVFTSLAIVCIIKKKMSLCETEMQKYMPLVKQDVMKFEVFILGGQRIDQKRSKGWWRGSRERIEMEGRIRNIYTCLCLFPQGAFLLSSPLDLILQ